MSTLFFLINYLRLLAHLPQNIILANNTTWFDISSMEMVLSMRNPFLIRNFNDDCIVLSFQFMQYQ